MFFLSRAVCRPNSLPAFAICFERGEVCRQQTDLPVPVGGPSSVGRDDDHAQRPFLHPVRLFADRAAPLSCGGQQSNCCQFAGRMRWAFSWCCNKAPSSCNCSTSRARSEGSNCGAAIAATPAITCSVSGLARCDRVVTVAATHGNSVDDRCRAWWRCTESLRRHANGTDRWGQVFCGSGIRWKVWRTQLVTINKSAIYGVRWHRTRKSFRAEFGPLFRLSERCFPIEIVSGLLPCQCRSL